MDLRLKGKTAIVCAASNGLGRACAAALAGEGVHVVINARTAETLEATATALRAASPDVTVATVVGDVRDDAVRGRLVEAAGDAPDILVNNAGGPPPGDFRDWDRQTWLDAIDANMLTAIDLIRRTVDGMTERGFGRIVNITSSVVRIPVGVLGLSNATRAGLTNFVLGLAPTVSARGVTINNLLPGPFDTDRLRGSKQITQHLTANETAGRLGDPAELGATCAFLCSEQAGYMTGQNLLIDGGRHPGNF